METDEYAIGRSIRSVFIKALRMQGTRTLPGASPRGMEGFLAGRKVTEQQGCPFSTAPGTK